MPAFLDELRARRVPHMLALYIGVAWGVVQFVSFLEERYLLSPHLTDVTLLAVALLLPSVLLVSFNHGRPGADAWQRSTKLGVPANLVIAGGVLFLTFSGKSLGAVTTTMSVTDENGRSVERVVAKSEFRKRLAIFDLDAAPSDTAGQWLRYALPMALSVDLSQDMFVNMRCSCVFTEELRKAGYADGANVPLSLAKKLAQEKHLGYFMTGRIAESAGELEVTVSLYETARGRLVQERSFRGSDPLALVDEISVQLRRDLEVPARHIEATPDLPVAELVTGSRAALRELALGSVAQHYRQDWRAAVAHYEAAIEHDPNFALAGFYAASVHRWLNQSPRADALLQSVMGRLYRLPETYQYEVKSQYYIYRGEAEKALAMARMRAELAPEDLDAQRSLASLHQMRDDKPAAIAALRRILELDPTQHEHLSTIGALYERSGDTERALEYHTRYLRSFPGEVRAYLPIGDLNRRVGRHDAARESYEKALLVDPTSVEVTLRLAGLERDNGRFAEAEQLLADALDRSRTAADSLQSYSALRAYHVQRGELRRALAYEPARAAALRAMPELTRLGDALQSLPLYVQAGDAAAAVARLAAITAQLQPPFDKMYGSIGGVWLYSELEDAAALEAAITTLEQSIEAMSVETLRPTAVEARARAEAMRGRCDAAIPLFRRKLELEPTDVMPNRHLGRCQRALGRHSEAVRSFERLLAAAPYEPRTNLDLALTYREMGDHARAAVHLRRAQTVWAAADAGFRPATELRTALAAR